MRIATNRMVKIKATPVARVDGDSKAQKRADTSSTSVPTATNDKAAISTSFCAPRG